MITKELIEAYKKQNPAKYELKKEALLAKLAACEGKCEKKEVEEVVAPVEEAPKEVTKSKSKK